MSGKNVIDLSNIDDLGISNDKKESIGDVISNSINEQRETFYNALTPSRSQIPVFKSPQEKLLEQILMELRQINEKLDR